MSARISPAMISRHEDVSALPPLAALSLDVVRSPLTERPCLFIKRPEAFQTHGPFSVPDQRIEMNKRYKAEPFVRSVDLRIKKRLGFGAKSDFEVFRCDAHYEKNGEHKVKSVVLKVCSNHPKLTAGNKALGSEHKMSEMLFDFCEGKTDAEKKRLKHDFITVRGTAMVETQYGQKSAVISNEAPIVSSTEFLSDKSFKGEEHIGEALIQYVLYEAVAQPDKLTAIGLQSGKRIANWDGKLDNIFIDTETGAIRHADFGGVVEEGEKASSRANRALLSPETPPDVDFQPLAAGIPVNHMDNVILQINECRYDAGEKTHILSKPKEEQFDDLLDNAGMREPHELIQHPFLQAASPETANGREVRAIAIDYIKKSGLSLGLSAENE